MAKQNPKLILRTNVLAILQHRGGPLRSNETGVTRLRALKIAQGTAQRLLGADTSIGIDLVQELADGLHVAAWQLLVPGLDPAKPQTLSVDPTAWPFAKVPRRAYFDLAEEDRLVAQGALANAISELAKG